MLNTFQTFIGHLYFFFWELFAQIISHLFTGWFDVFFFLMVLNFCSSFYSLGINPCLMFSWQNFQLHPTKLSLHSANCVFSYSLINIWSCSFAVGGFFKKTCPCFYLEVLLLTFLSQGLKVSSLTLRSLIHFELIFLREIKWLWFHPCTFRYSEEAAFSSDACLKTLLKIRRL